MMQRLDRSYRELAAASKAAAADKAQKLREDLAAREKTLVPSYSALALHFADLHDRPNRMKAKGTIREALDWSSSRRFFYWRLRRRLAEEQFLRQAPVPSRADGLSAFYAAIGASSDSQDRQVAEAAAGKAASLKDEVERLRRRQITRQLAQLAIDDRSALLASLKEVLDAEVGLTQLDR